MTQTVNEAAAHEALGVRAQFGASILEASKTLQKKYFEIADGKIKDYKLHITDPRAPSSKITLTMKREDSKIYTDYRLHEPIVWKHCKGMREEEAKLKAAGALDQEFMFEWFKSTWALEVYILIKYGIDLCDPQGKWCTKGNDEYKKLGWVMDNDPFASRYKCTNNRESIGMTNPFEKIWVGV